MVSSTPSDRVRGETAMHVRKTAARMRKREFMSAISEGCCDGS
jgi:hypothetical protein